MDTSEQIKVWQDFLEGYYLAELLEKSRKGGKHLGIDFALLSKHSPELADVLLEQPEEVIKAAEISIKNIDLPVEIKEFKLRLFNAPENQRIMIRNIRSQHLGKLLILEGTVRQKSDVRPQVTSARFECPSCGNIIPVLQLDKKFKEPNRCGCGRKGKFRLLSKELVDAQGIVLEEATKDLEGGEQPKRINLLLKNDLVSPITEKKTNPGSTIRVVGILKEVPIILRSGGLSTKFDLIVDANGIEPMEEDYSSIDIDEETEAEIKKISQDPKVYEKLTKSLAPGIFGHDKIKEGLVMQFMGGVKKLRDDGVMTRGDIHVLLIGDPGAGKTVHGDTKIVMCDGSLKKIKDLVEDNISKTPKNIDNDYYDCKTINGVKSLNQQGKQEKKNIKVLWKKRAEKMFKVKTALGKEIICTKTNPLFIQKQGYVKATKLEKVKEGDFIACTRKIEVDGAPQPLKQYHSSLKTRQKQINKPLKTSKEFWKFIAYILSEGYCKEGVIEFINSEKELLDDYNSIVKKLFKTAPKAYKKENSKKLNIFSKNLTNFLKNLEPKILTTSFHKRIPDLLFKCSNLEIGHFLKAFFEAEAHVNTKTIEMTIASKEMLEQIQYLLLRFGILSSQRPTIKYASNTKNKTRRTYHKLTILADSLTSFQKEIGFITKRKKDRLNMLTKKNRNTNMDVVPNLKTTLKKVRKFLFLTQFDMGVPRTTYQHFERGDRNPSQTSLKKIVKQINQRFKQLQRLGANNNLTVKEIRNTLNLSQTHLAKISECSQTLISQYELNKLKSQKNKKIDNASKEFIINNILTDINLTSLISRLNMLSKANIFWDRILEIKETKTKNPWIYDIEVDETHNFIANGLIVHNSQLLKRASVVAPKSRYVSGKGVSGAGLSAAVVKDEFLQGWSLEAGAMVLANKGILMIDELDKMSDDDRSAMHEGLEQQSISISKANIQATLRCETTVLAAANPKFGRFDPYETIAKQIDLPPALINRFDLIFTIKDMPDADKDEKMANFILTMHKKSETEEAPIETDLLRKYLSYGRLRINPLLTQAALEELKTYYVKMRSSGSSEDGGLRAIPISPRQLEALIRLSEAAAKVRLSDKITKKDARKAISLLHYCLEQVGLDPETGKIDIDRISTGITTTERSKMVGVRELINELEDKVGKTIPLEDVIKEGKERGIDEEKIVETIEKLKRSGDLFEPKRGFISKI